MTDNKRIKLIPTGTRFGRWTVIELSAERGKDGAVKWECRCDCGTEKSVFANGLRNGTSTSCGCYHRTIMKGTNHRVVIRGKAAHRAMFCMYKSSAQRKGHEFALSWKDFQFLTEQPCYYCGIEKGHVYQLSRSYTSGPFIGNGIDRKDNSRGYIAENVVTCCKRCNYFKRDINEAEFLNLCRKIVLHAPKGIVDPVKMWQSLKTA